MAGNGTGVRATVGAYTPEDEEVIGKGLSSSLRPLNYHMAFRIAVFCVNIPVFSGQYSDLESTVHSLESCFLALREHTQGQGWSTSVGSRPRGSKSLILPKVLAFTPAATPTSAGQSPTLPECLRWPQLLCSPHASACLGGTSCQSWACVSWGGSWAPGIGPATATNTS